MLFVESLQPAFEKQTMSFSQRLHIMQNFYPYMNKSITVLAQI